MKRGFTLIELLGVIIILAALLAIVAPIVANLIRDSKKSTVIDSAKLYLKAVDYAITYELMNDYELEDGTYKINESGNLCLDEDCTNELKISASGKKPTGGNITIKNGNIEDVSIVLSEKTIVKNSNGELVYQTESTLNTLCKLKDGSANTIGAKYECDFGDGKRNFYILELGSDPVTDSTLESDEVALILDNNYGYSGPWCDRNGSYPSSIECNADGLKNIFEDLASSWSKLESSQMKLPTVQQILKADGKTEQVEELEDDIYLTNEWLYIDALDDDYNTGDITPYGYWTSTIFDESRVWTIAYYGYVGSDLVENYEHLGMRPVVNIKKSELGL